MAITCFVIGSFLGSLLSQSGWRHGHPAGFGAIALLLAALAAVEGLGVHEVLLDIGILSVAMSMINPLITKIGLEPVSLTFVTGTLERIGVHLASAVVRASGELQPRPGDAHLRRAGVETTLWVALIGGAVLSGVIGPRFRMQGLLAPSLLMATLAVVGG